MTAPSATSVSDNAAYGFESGRHAINVLPHVYAHLRELETQRTRLNAAMIDLNNAIYQLQTQRDRCMDAIRHFAESDPTSLDPQYPRDETTCARAEVRQRCTVLLQDVALAIDEAERGMLP